MWRLRSSERKGGLEGRRGIESRLVGNWTVEYLYLDLGLVTTVSASVRRTIQATRSGRTLTRPEQACAAGESLHCRRGPPRRRICSCDFPPRNLQSAGVAVVELTRAQ
jgi:hypothetical protein